jgi:hypothetical protein
MLGVRWEGANGATASSIVPHRQVNGMRVNRPTQLGTHHNDRQQYYFVISGTLPFLLLPGRSGSLPENAWSGVWNSLA